MLCVSSACVLFCCVRISFLFVYECMCVLAHLWPQMHVNVTQFLLASFDLSLFPWQQKQAPVRQLTEADNMKWVGEMSEENDREGFCVSVEVCT